MKAFFKENLIIIIAFSLPVLLIVGVALSAYLPTLWLSTNYNFVYASCDGDWSYRRDCVAYMERYYTIQDGTLQITESGLATVTSPDRVLDMQESYSPRLFIYDTQRHETREITTDQAQTFTYSELLTSPDGVTISGEYDRGADLLFFYGGRSSYERYLVKGNSRQKLQLINNEERFYYRDNFHFVGWVVPGRN